MTDKDRADRLVELGIVDRDSLRPYMYSLKSTDGHFVGVRYEASDIVGDWRVAGACLERMLFGLTYYKGHDEFASGKWVVAKNDATVTSILAMNESLPRAIIEAYIEAVSDE